MPQKRKKLYLMCGPAGSGKTTWVREHATPGVSAHISRDRIRFDMVKEDEYYFSRENDVYAEFCGEIHDAFYCPWVEEIYADATHLTKKAREKLMREILINPELIDVYAIVVNPGLAQCLSQNALRKGRERVPEKVIANMYTSIENPINDDINYEMIIENDRVVYGKVN